MDIEHKADLYTKAQLLNIEALGLLIKSMENDGNAELRGML